MNHAIDLLHQAEAAGIRLEVEGGEVYAEGLLTDEMVSRLRAHKAELLAVLLGSSTETDLPKAIREHLEERAAIRENCGGEPIEKAEARAALSDATNDALDHDVMPDPSTAIEPFNQEAMDAIKRGQVIPVWSELLGEWL